MSQEDFLCSNFFRGANLKDHYSVDYEKYSPHPLLQTSVVRWNKSVTSRQAPPSLILVVVVAAASVRSTTLQGYRSDLSYTDSTNLTISAFAQHF